MRRELRLEFRIGMLFFVLYSLLNQFTNTPHFILGILIGASICLMIIGSLRETPHNALKAFKRRLIMRLLKGRTPPTSQ